MGTEGKRKDKSKSPDAVDIVLKGGVSATIAAAMTPFDRRILQDQLAEPPKSFAAFWADAPFRGAGYSFVGKGIKWSTFFYLKGYLKEAEYSPYVAVAIASLVGSAVTVPVGVIKTRVMYGQKKNADPASPPEGFLSQLKKSCHSGRMRIARDSFAVFGLSQSQAAVKYIWPKPDKGWQSWAHAATSTTVGAFGGFILASPAAVIASQQTILGGTVRDTFCNIYRRGGARAFFSSVGTVLPKTGAMSLGVALGDRVVEYVRPQK